LITLLGNAAVAWADHRDGLMVPRPGDLVTGLRPVVNGFKVLVVAALLLMPTTLATGAAMPASLAVAWFALSLYSAVWLVLDVGLGFRFRVLDARVSERGALNVLLATLVPLASPMLLALASCFGIDVGDVGTDAACVTLGLGVWMYGFASWGAAEAGLAGWRQARAVLAENNYAPDARDFLHDGAWSLSRHPNYRGELAMLLGYAIISDHVIVWACMAWIALTVHVPNLVRLDRHMHASRGEAYARYAETAWLL